MTVNTMAIHNVVRLRERYAITTAAATTNSSSSNNNKIDNNNPIVALC